MYSKLKGLMTEKKITQLQLASLLNISVSTLNFKINGKSDFTVSEAKKVCKFFNKDLKEIFYTEDIKEANAV